MRTTNGFLPPIMNVYPLTTWDAVPSLPLYTDVEGEEVLAGACIQVAYDHAHLWLRASGNMLGAYNADLPAESPDFWRQDHIDLHLALESRLVQVILNPDGRTFDPQGLGVVTEGRVTAERWMVTARIPWRNLGVTPKEGQTLTGCVAHVRWDDAAPMMACVSPVDIGFHMAGRYAQFRLAGGEHPVRLQSLSFSAPLRSGDNTAQVTLTNQSTAPVAGRVVLMRERGAEVLPTVVQAVVLPAGDTTIEAALTLTRPSLTRVSICFEIEGYVTTLGAVTLRATVSPVKNDHPHQHPYLFYEEADLPRLRKKFADETVVIDETGIPVVDEEVSLEITAHCLDWFRVAKETMLRDGAGGMTPSARRLWELMSPAAQAAWRDVTRTVQPTDAQLGVLIPALNAMLARPDFYTAEAFGAIALPPEITEMIPVHKQLTAEERFRVNRAIFQSAVECVGNFKVDMLWKASSLLVPWLATGDPACIALATRAVSVADRAMILGPYTDLGEGTVAAGLAKAYDAFVPYFSAEDRALWVRVLRRLLRLYLATARCRHWNVTTNANANPVVNAGTGLLAIALLEEAPEEAQAALAYARKYLWRWLDYSTGPDGGYTEGAQYWQYAMENYLPFAIALERVQGTDDGLLGHPGIVNAMNMVKLGLCNDGSLHGVNDTVPMPIGMPIAWFLARRTGDAFARWYGNHAERIFRQMEAQGRSVVYTATDWFRVFFRPDGLDVVEQPPLPTAILLESIQYATVRSGHNWDCVWDAGMKGSRAPYTHHNQADTGSYYIDLRGERLLIDPGYYKDKPTDHNLLLIDGIGPCQPEDDTGDIIACESRGDLRYLACDATAAYRGAAHRVARHLVLVGDEGIILLDDVLPTDPAAEITTQYQAGGVTEDLGKGRSVLISGRTAKLRLDLHTVPECTLTLHPERSLHDTHWGYRFADCRLFPITGTYRACDEPLVTVILDATEHQLDHATVTCDERHIRVYMPTGREVVFTRVDAQWRLDGAGTRPRASTCGMAQPRDE